MKILFNTYLSRPGRHALGLAVRAFIACFILCAYTPSANAQAADETISATNAPAPTAKKTADDWSDEISDKMSDLNEKMKTLTGTATNAVPDLFTKKQEKHLKNQMERTNRANKKLKEEKAFKNMGKKDKFKPKKNDPDPAEAGAADAAEPASEDSEYDEEDLENLYNMLTDAEGLMTDTDDALNELKKVKADKAMALSMLAEGESIVSVEAELLKRNSVYDDLADLLNGSHHDHAFYVAIKASKMASQICGTLYDIQTCFAQQDAAGWNASSTGAILAGIAGALELLAEGLEINMYVSDGDQSRKTILCIAQIGTEHAAMINSLSSVTSGVATITEDAGALAGEVDKLITTTDRIEANLSALSNDVAVMNGKLDAMTAMMIRRFDYIDQLLCTPQGSRPDFPLKLKEDKTSGLEAAAIPLTSDGGAASALETWRYTHFGTITNSGAANDLADFEGDGSVNLIEFGMATDPTLTNSVPVEYAVTTDVIEYTYQRNVAAIDELSFEVAWTDDLTAKNWNSTGVTETIISDDGLTQLVMAQIPKGDTDMRFVTLFITRN